MNTQRFKKPWLIQRAAIVKQNPIKHPTFSEAINTDYMGSSEFEFGAMGHSLRRMHAAAFTGVGLSVLKVEEITHPITQQTLRVCAYYPQQEIAEYTEHIKAMYADKLRLKEQSEFDEASLRRESSHQTNFWWDIENDVMWTFHKPTTNKLENYLKASWQRMGLYNVD